MAKHGKACWLAFCLPHRPLAVVSRTWFTDLRARTFLCKWHPCSDYGNKPCQTSHASAPSADHARVLQSYGGKQNEPKLCLVHPAVVAEAVVATASNRDQEGGAPAAGVLTVAVDVDAVEPAAVDELEGNEFLDCGREDATDVVEEARIIVPDEYVAGMALVARLSDGRELALTVNDGTVSAGTLISFVVPPRPL